MLENLQISFEILQKFSFIEEQRAEVDLDNSLPVLCDTTHCVEPEPELIVDVQGHNNRGRRGNKAKGTVSKPTADPSLIAGSLRQAYLGEIGDEPLVLQVLKTDENDQLDTIQARLSDGVESADNVLFYHNIKKNVKPTERFNEDGALERRKPFISVLEYDISFKKYLVISKFKYLNEEN